MYQNKKNHIVGISYQSIFRWILKI